ncbi:XAC2610-related protein [Lysobacter claricitrinus]|uniref:XAC2610-related protein n=1 Tax=Lysobacter claricitrinus TaxID=3367728 RepID=UPI0037DB42BB
MRRTNVLLLALLPLLAVAARPALHVSKQFDVRIRPDTPCAPDGDDCIGPATLVFTARGGRAIPALHVDTLKLDAADPADVRINDAQMYGAQSTLIAGDFDFDGHDDLAVRTGDDGPYGGPTYDVYVFDRAHGRFVEDGALSGLTYDTLGMFGVDARRHRISTWAKSGCCWHEYVEYTNGAKGLVAVYKRTEDATRDPMTITEARLDAHGRWHRRSHREPVKG